MHQAPEKQTRLEIRIYHHPNPEIRSYLVPIPITRLRVERFPGPPEDLPQDLPDRLGVLGAQVVRELLSLPQVAELTIKPKEIRLKKRSRASWESFEAQILTILQRGLQKRQWRLVKK